LLFLRQGALWAYALSDGRERQIVDSVRDFAAAPNGAQIALIRDGRGQRDLWVVQRDGSGLTQLSNDARSEATPIWAPDNSAIMYASASDKQPYQREWIAWSAWCATSEVRQVVLATSTVSTITPGCDPAISPDGRRLAVASPPEQNEPGLSAENPPKIVNAIRLVNRQGQNGWNFARADGDPNATSNAGRDVYAPAFSPDGQQVLYHRFLGYQVLVDISLSEIGGSFEGKGKPMYSGAGWLLPAQFAADSRSLVISENNYSDARGFGGYDNWSATVIRMEGNREVAMPSGPLTMLGQNVETLRRAQAAIWVPGSSELFVQLPPGWRADLPTNEPLGATGPGEIWRWKPGEGPQQRLVSEVDFASPLGWLR
jgi:dipeptidyl aminopeptidase/acylaminoacyl peptidase